jgi:hypothetical protein
VYLPCKNHSIDVYKNSIEAVENTLFRYADKGITIVMGDYNAELPSRNQTHFMMDNRSNMLSNFMLQCNMVAINALEMCTGAEFSNVPYNSERETLIDHVLIPECDIERVEYCSILDDNVLNVSTHRPIVFSLSCTFKPNECQHSENIINWRNVKSKSIENYRNWLADDKPLHRSVLDDIHSHEDIDTLYATIVQSIQNATESCIPKSKFKPYIKPYWNKELSKLKSDMSKTRLLWLKENRPRGNEHNTYREYKKAKYKFRKIHREAVQTHIEKQERDIDTAAEIDNNEFWRLVNKNRKRRKHQTTFEMNFNGTIFKEAKHINLGWYNYFSDLYSPTQNEDFRDEYLNSCEQELLEINNKISNINFEISIDESEIEKALKTCKRNKACGYDKIYYENLMFGGPIIIKAITKLFRNMSSFAYIPTDLKRGIIITMFKGGNKCKSDPNSYRAISLCSTILKLFEKILLLYIESEQLITVNALQGGFQKNVNCVMTSFLLRESVYYAREHGSKLYTCFLDVRQCFDRVSHSVLMLKLYNTGINKSIFKIILNMFKDVYSCVKSQGHTSEWFPVLQGTRQGQVLSPRLYLIFVNDLMNILDSSEHCLKIQGSKYGCPTSADDMVLVSLTKRGLDNMLEICFENSRSERYLYNAQKSNVVVFNENKNEFENNRRKFKLGKESIKETDSYVHLGIPCNKYMTLNENVNLACSKIRKTYYSLADCGVHKNGLHPLSSKHLYETVVLSKALYGSEMWCDLTDDQILSLERAHRQCVKNMQSMHQSTRTDVALSSMGILPIEFEIDKRKLLLFGQLCNLDTRKRIKTLFISRLFQFMIKPRKAQGFISDLYRIFGKYHITHIFIDFYHNGSFPSANVWKQLVKTNIRNLANYEYRTRLLLDNDLKHFYYIHNEILPFSLWRLSQLYRDMLPFCKTVMLAIGRYFSRKYLTVCPACKGLTDSVVEHLVLFCITNDSNRHNLWCCVHEALGNINFENYCNRQPHDQIIEMFTGFTLVDLDEKIRIRLMQKTCRLLHYMCKPLTFLNK